MTFAEPLSIFRRPLVFCSDSRRKNHEGANCTDMHQWRIVFHAIL